MTPLLDETHDLHVQSWVESANTADSDFPIQNLPFGVFRRDESSGARIGIAIGDRILDLTGLGSEGLLGDTIPANAVSLNTLMAAGTAPRQALRRQLHALLRTDASPPDRQTISRHLVLQADVEMLLPADVGDYTDFYASIFHATNVGKLFRPDNPLLPNYKYIPIGYHGARRHWSQVVLRSVGLPVKLAMPTRIPGLARRRRLTTSSKSVFLWPREMSWEKQFRLQMPKNIFSVSAC